MPLTAHFGPLFEVQADWLIVGAWEGEAFTGAPAQLDARMGGALTRFGPHELVLVAPPSAPVEEVRQSTRRAAVEGQAVGLARELVNTPPCDLYPESFAARAQQIAAATGVACTVFDENQLQAE